VSHGLKVQRVATVASCIYLHFLFARALNSDPPKNEEKAQGIRWSHADKNLALDANDLVKLFGKELGDAIASENK
jgi:hypothetical protein